MGGDKPTDQGGGASTKTIDNQEEELSIMFLITLPLKVSTQISHTLQDLGNLNVTVFTHRNDYMIGILTYSWCVRLSTDTGGGACGQQQI